MAISLKTRKMLWGRSACRCSFPKCRVEVFEGETETDDPANIGDEAHIIAREDGGPRGDPAYPKEKRDKFDNLLLLCKNHHKLVDDRQNEYTVEVLRDMKVSHVQWVKEALGLDSAKQRDEEMYASIVDKWVVLANLDDWERWSSHVFSADGPQMRVCEMEALEELDSYLLNRVWPRRYGGLELAISNFRNVLRDFRGVFMSYAEKWGEGAEKLYLTEKVYKISDYNEELYKYKLKEYNYQVDLTLDLALELTRAANRVGDAVRSHLSKSFRVEEGYLSVNANPKSVYNERLIVPLYESGAPMNDGYPGLGRFLTDRAQRDYSYGNGVAVQYEWLVEQDNALGHEDPQ